MKPKSFMFVLIMCLPVAALFAQWQALGPAGGSFRAMAVAPSNDNIQYLASPNSPCNIWKTTDGGNSWNRIGSINYYVYSLGVDPTNPNTVYAGGVYMYRSTNGGATWTQLSTPTNYFYDFKVHPTIPTTIMASCWMYINNNWHMGFVKSTNSGTNWVSETLTTDTSYAYAIAIDPTNPNNVYVGGYAASAGTSIPRIFKSTDGGSNFTNISTIPSSASMCYSLLVHQTNSNYVYAGTMYGIYRSTDGGTNWTAVANTSFYYNYSLSTTPANPNLIYSGGNGAVHRSTDQGATWIMLSTGMTGSIVYGVAASRTQASNVSAVNNADYFRSTNTGTNWAAAHNGLLATSISAMANAPSAQGTVYIDNEGTSMYKTTNSGDTWLPVTKALSCGSLCDLVVYNNNPNTVVCLEGSG